jgi:hypothetical protein
VVNATGGEPGWRDDELSECEASPSVGRAVAVMRWTLWQ